MFYHFKLQKNIHKKQIYLITNNQLLENFPIHIFSQQVIYNLNLMNKFYLNQLFLYNFCNFAIKFI